MTHAPDTLSRHLDPGIHPSWGGLLTRFALFAVAELALLAVAALAVRWILQHA